MEYATMIHNMPQMAQTYHQPMSRPNSQNGPRHVYTFPYAGDQMFMIPHMPHHRNMSDPTLVATHSKQTEPKPRLAKDEVELLENEFQKNPKPSSQRKREIADLLKVENPRINNWFQNRRAKAKQMLRRELDIKVSGGDSSAVSESSPSDRHDDGSVSDFYSSSNTTQALQPSTAAFPTVEQTQQPQQQQQQPLPQPQQQQPAAAAFSDVSVANSAAPSVEEYPSPKSLVFPPAANPDLAYAPVVVNGFLASHNPMAYDTAHSSPQQAGSLDGSEQMPQDFQQQPMHGLYLPYTTASPMNMEPIMAPIPSYPQEHAILASCETPMDQGMAAAMSQQMSSPESAAYSPASAVSDLRFKSPPPPSNIATRRSKGSVPAMLSPTALRCHPYGPKTVIDAGKRIDGPSPIRRIASATGLMPSRIQKASLNTIPRSPLYLERNKEALLQSLQNGTAMPLTRSVSTNVSPVAQMVVPAVSQPAFFNVEQPALSTPPGTPGFTATLNDPRGLGLDATAVCANTTTTTWNYIPQDEALLTPSLGSFGSDEFPLVPSAPSYVINSQPATPSVGNGMGPSYFPLPLQGNAGMVQPDYAFTSEPFMIPSDLTIKSSPGLMKSSKQFQFTPNVTPQDFFATDR